MNPFAMTIFKPQKEYWPSWGSNLQPPVLKSATLPTELWGSVTQMKDKWELLFQYRILTHFQMTNFRLFQTERVCRRQFQI